MANIVSLEERLKLPKAKRAALIRKRKISAVQKVFQCTQCIFKCRKCGVSMTRGKEPPQNNIDFQNIPYQLCITCTEEYLDYIEWLKGNKHPDYYWHNDLWLDTWTKWIDYQNANNNYLKSKEFRQLLKELKETGID